MKTLAPVVLLLISLTARSQSVSSSVVNTTGNSYSFGRYKIDWSVGELALVNSMQPSSNLLIVTNGFLQPNLAETLEKDSHHHFTADEIKILPNPTHGRVEVNFSTQEQGTLYLYVYDVNGKVLTNDHLLNSGIKISRLVDLSSFSAGTYFLRIEMNALPGSVSKTGSYKIVKL